MTPLRPLVLVLLLLVVNSVAAKGRLSKVEINLIAEGSELAVADMQSCSESFGAPYLDEAGLLEARLLQLLDAAGYDVDAFTPLHYKKIDALKQLHQGPSATAKACETQLRLAQRTRATLEVHLKRLGSKIPKGGAEGDCGRSADYYQDRFRSSGKISDLTCYQRAGLRELNSSVPR